MPLSGISHLMHLEDLIKGQAWSAVRGRDPKQGRWVCGFPLGTIPFMYECDASHGSTAGTEGMVHEQGRPRLNMGGLAFCGVVHHWVGKHHYCLYRILEKQQPGGQGIGGQLASGNEQALRGLYDLLSMVSKQLWVLCTVHEERWEAIGARSSKERVNSSP